ncbi:hypothetical protein [Massilia sp. S19_KUP03_FR1]|uniref:hypothetical protein n=1 Tax=Massilia sp. S19_KUP03_FR1 TaxID=3025503 RepID=UPI002FCD8BF2
MKKKHSSNRAIFILESPWELDDGDANRSSVLPFIEGIAKYAGDVEVLHANFYDKSSFKKALGFLSKKRYENAVIYIASHGGEVSIGGVKTGDILFEIGEVAKSLNITGVMLGACLAGGNTINMEVFTEGTNITWCAGYSTEVFWMRGTLLDCSIIGRMLDLDDDDGDFNDKKAIINALGEAIAPFSKSNAFGIRKKPTRLDESVEFVVQARGKGKVAQTVTEDVFKVWDTKQI